MRREHLHHHDHCFSSDASSLSTTVTAVASAPSLDKTKSAISSRSSARSRRTGAPRRPLRNRSLNKQQQEEQLQRLQQQLQEQPPTTPPRRRVRFRTEEAQVVVPSSSIEQTSRQQQQQKHELWWQPDDFAQFRLDGKSAAREAGRTIGGAVGAAGYGAADVIISVLGDNTSEHDDDYEERVLEGILRRDSLSFLPQPEVEEERREESDNDGSSPYRNRRGGRGRGGRGGRYCGGRRCVRGLEHWVSKVHHERRRCCMRESMQVVMSLQRFQESPEETAKLYRRASRASRIAARLLAVADAHHQAATATKEE